MDFGTILGLLSGVGIIFLGILRQDGDLSWFMNINSIIIVFGGTVAAAMVNYPLKNIIGFTNYFWFVIRIIPSPI